MSETWLLTSRKEHKLMIFEKRVMRRICGRKRGKWRTDGEDCTKNSYI